MTQIKLPIYTATGSIHVHVHVHVQCICVYPCSMDVYKSVALHGCMYMCTCT